ncbi:MAG TPA: universal stress protein [Chloroflexota bacterium]|nr:universal stress protein [Chloroflexota bacterium]
MVRLVRTFLVPYGGGARASQMLRLACQLAAIDGDRVVALYVNLVHPTLPLRELPDELDRPGRLTLLHASTVAEAVPGSPASFRYEAMLVRGRDLSRSIVGQARILQADAIFMAPRQRRPWWRRVLSGLLSTSTTSQVVRLAPCAVIVGYPPGCRAGPASLQAGSAVAEAERHLLAGTHGHIM